VYTLRATPTFTSTGNTISTQFYRSSGGTVTGYIVDGDMGGALGIDTSVGGGVAYQGINASGTFLWSDLADGSVHVNGNTSGTAGGSRDWTNDVLLEDLTQTQVISN